MPTPRSHPRALSAVIVAGALVAACGGSDKKTVATTSSEAAAATSTSSVSSTSTSVASTTTGGTAAGTSTTATVPAAPTYALTGMPIDDPARANRPALVIKVNNVASARPQSGINQADVVYEEVVEGGITRLAAVFNSHDPDRVGPVRSVRKTDQSLVWPIGGVFAYSGGAPYAIASINTAEGDAFSTAKVRRSQERLRNP